MSYSATVRGERYSFADLRILLAKANDEKSGDQLAEIAAANQRERVAAKMALADVPLGEIVDRPVIDPDRDDVSRAILDHHDAAGFASIQSMTVGEFREFLLLDETNDTVLKGLHRAITPELAAAVAKLMSNKDLIVAASKIRNVTRCRNTMGLPGTLGIRVQPNHPSDSLDGILLSTLDGLLFGCGDAVIGVNPATESVNSVGAILRVLQQLVQALQIPTQTCVLSHVTTQLAAMERGAPVDLLFQSIAGTQQANESFGTGLAQLDEGRQRVLDHHRTRDVAWVGSQVMYFETGQGSSLSAEAHHGVDQLTLEARAYGVARLFDPFLVNSVIGFIGPEYLYDERQIQRAGLEDHFMGKLLGLPMGCDVCYTNHVDADQNTTDGLLVMLTAAGCNFYMGVPCADDVMLNFQTTSYHDAVSLRKLFHLRPAPEFAQWLESKGISWNGDPARNAGRREELFRTMSGLLEAAR
ncbi:ethanolamine ammonia-lyase subunit EutB [bacterium]|nr:ethanolamine ammonia-lyase subunit EutB [bacterium]